MIKVFLKALADEATEGLVSVNPDRSEPSHVVHSRRINDSGQSLLRLLWIG
jgi:hypothetical protein